MNRTARKVAMSAAAGAVALALTSPAAVADDGDGYEGERDGYSEEYDDSDDDSDDDYETDDDSGDYSDDDSGDYSDDDHEDGDGDEHDEYDDDSDGREYDAYREAHHEDHADESGSHSAYRGHGDGDSRHDDRHEKWGGQAAGDSEDADGRESESQTESFTEQQTAILTHLSRADAFLADLSERISAADLDPGLKNALLGLIDERRNHLAGLVAQVRTATSWEDLKSLRDDAYGQMTEPAT